MHLLNMNHAVNIANRANRLLMVRYQSNTDHDPLILSGDVATTEADLVAKGNKACFAGYVAISPEFKNAGGLMLYSGTPIYVGYQGSKAIAAWLDIEIALANSLVYGIDTGRPAVGLPDFFSPYYGKNMTAIVKADVKAKLQEIITDYPSSVFDG